MPCLHTLLTPTGLNLLKSAPLMSAFPVTPPRAPPSPAPLLASIRSLIQSGSLSGPAWKSTATWRAQIRKAFAAYHALLKDVAEELVTARSFAEEFHLFLDQIAQPIQLLQLIADDFESEFGPGATRGLLGVGEAGGDNLISVMDFCAARKPSELIARVKQRVAEKQERERRTKLLDKLKVELKELDVRIRGLLLEYRSASGTGSAAGDKSNGADAAAPEKTTRTAVEAEAAASTIEASSSDPTRDASRSTRADLDGAIDEKAERSSHSIRLQQELEAALDERDRVKAELEDLRATEEADEVARKKRAVAEKKGLTMVPPPPRSGGGGGDGPEPGRESGEGAPREEEAGFKLGSSRDLLAVPVQLAASRGGEGQLHGDAPLVDPFSTSAPRAVSPAAGSAKGKAKAVTQAGKVCRAFWNRHDLPAMRGLLTTSSVAQQKIATHRCSLCPSPSSALLQPPATSYARRRPPIWRSSCGNQQSLCVSCDSPDDDDVLLLPPEPDTTLLAAGFGGVFSIPDSRPQSRHLDDHQICAFVQAGEEASAGERRTLRDLLPGLSSCAAANAGDGGTSFACDRGRETVASLSRRSRPHGDVGGRLVVGTFARQDQSGRGFQHLRGPGCGDEGAVGKEEAKEEARRSLAGARGDRIRSGRHGRRDRVARCSARCGDFADSPQTALRSALEDSSAKAVSAAYLYRRRAAV